MAQYRDNYPYNIEAPQRVYVQYSQDIDFDYSTGKYPLGESFEGFVWETIYNPLPHSYGDLSLGRHVWMRWRIGEKDNWTLPMRFTDSILNIETTALEQILGTNQSQFRFKYTMNSGEIIYSEYMVITNGIDGRGILNSRIVDVNLYLDYTDNTTQNLGRVVGYNGNGFPLDTLNPGEIPYIDADGNIIWTQFIDILDLNLSGTSPISYTHGVISHLNTDGNKHIPIGGVLNDLLTTNGSGTYIWQSMTSLISTYIGDITTLVAAQIIDDTAGSGDTDVTWSANKLTTMFGTINTFGIKYAVADLTALAAITGMVANEQAVVESNRYVYKYDGANWIQFFALDGPHNHNDLYYTKTEISNPNSGILIDWTNISNKPSSYQDWTIVGNTGSTQISAGETLSIVGGSGATTSLSGNTLTINTSGTTYSNGTGLDLAGTVFSHSDTSSVTDSGNLSTTRAIRNLTFDTFGHVLTHSSIDFAGVFAAINHSHSLLTRGGGLTGGNYDGTATSTFAVDFAGSGSAGTVARSDHSHTSSVIASEFSYPNSIGNTATVLYTKLNGGTTHKIVSLVANCTMTPPVAFTFLLWLGNVPSGYIPAFNHSFGELL